MKGHIYEYVSRMEKGPTHVSPSASLVVRQEEDRLVVDGRRGEGVNDELDEITSSLGSERRVSSLPSSVSDLKVGRRCTHSETSAGPICVNKSVNGCP